MTVQTAVETPMRKPDIEIGGVKVFADRDGDRVTGRVVLPGARASIPIDYCAQRTSESTVDPKSAMRLAAVTDYNQRVERGEPKTAAGRVVAQKYGCGLRSIQLWVKRHELGGIDGLRDDHGGFEPKLLVLDSDTARHAVSLAAWWCYRIGNVERIKNQVMAAAARVVSRYQIGDVLAAVEAYYAWPCDRANKYPFRTFVRWCRYGDDVAKWIARGKELGTETPPWKIRSQSRMRLREVGNLRTRADLNRLASDEDAESIDNTLAAMPDAYRTMLTRAAFGDTDAKHEAVSTFEVWWPKMPDALRREMEMLCAAGRMQPNRLLAAVLHRIRNGVRHRRATGAELVSK